MPQTQPQDRRRFRRIPFDREAFVLSEDDRHACELLDISFRGALLALKDAWRPAPNQSLELRIPLAGDEKLQITMSGSVVRVDEPECALRCDRMDIESMTLLRRLVEMNLGDEGLLERELSAFID